VGTVHLTKFLPSPELPERGPILAVGVAGHVAPSVSSHAILPDDHVLFGITGRQVVSPGLKVGVVAILEYYPGGILKTTPRSQDGAKKVGEVRVVSDVPTKDDERFRRKDSGTQDRAVLSQVRAEVGGEGNSGGTGVSASTFAVCPVDRRATAVRVALPLAAELAVAAPPDFIDRDSLGGRVVQSDPRCDGLRDVPRQRPEAMTPSERLRGPASPGRLVPDAQRRAVEATARPMDPALPEESPDQRSFP